MLLLLLYADDLILMSERASELQKQLDALASFCEQHRLTVNLSKTKVVVFETRQSDVCDFVLSGDGWRATSIWGLSSMPLRN